LKADYFISSEVFVEKEKIFITIERDESAKSIQMKTFKRSNLSLLGLWKIFRILRGAAFLRPLFFFIIFASGCSRLSLRQIANSDVSFTCLAGGSAERRSYVATGLTLPLQEIARFRVSSAVSQHLCATPDAIFVPTLDGRLSIVDLQISKSKSKKKILRRMKLAQGHSGTIAIARQSLVVAMRFGQETLLRYDSQSGDKLWEIDAGDIASEPLLADSLIYVAALYRHVDAYRLQDGKRRWQFRAESQFHASPALSQGILVAASDDGKIFGLEAASGKKLWEFDCHEPVLATPAICQNRIYAGTAGESVLVLNLQDGALLWKNKIGAKVVHSPAVSDSLVVFSCGDGRVRAFDINNGAPRWTFRAGSVIGTSPLIAASTVFVGSLDHNLYALDARSGKAVWQQELEGRVRTDPLIVGDQLIVASEDRVVYVFGQATASATN
jgi:outer membrane protein assembly factor BamB